ncbi:MAG: peptidyl-alpha-hydroxyglycine alpha-amidating lyase family protein [Chloroflexi bacterium]|nr:peptidyl-alpha-hydroxyglycine alpha-amidating lyase family protein [Chloroflexota bacterium]
MRVGNGDFVYEFIESWGTVPEGYELGGVPNGAVDTQGNVHVFTRTPHPVVVFDAEGNFIRSWGEGIFKRPHSAFIGPDESFYCTDDFDHTVRKFTLDGKLLMTLGTANQPSDTGYDGRDYHSIKRGDPPFNRPTSLAVGPTGELFVSDGYGNSRVHKFSPDGKLIKSWGEPGTGPGQFSIVHTVCVDKKGTVYVSDRENYRIQLFTSDGEYITEWKDFHRPCGMFIGVDDNLYVTELHCDNPRIPAPLPARLSVWSLDGKLLVRWGDDDIRGPGNFYAPHGLWGDPQGNLYVGELATESERFPRPADYPAVHKLIRVR